MLLLEFVLGGKPTWIAHAISHLLFQLHSLMSLIVHLLGKLRENKNMCLLVVIVVQQINDLLVFFCFFTCAVELVLV